MKLFTNCELTEFKIIPKLAVGKRTQVKKGEEQTVIAELIEAHKLQMKELEMEKERADEQARVERQKQDELEMQDRKERAEYTEKTQLEEQKKEKLMEEAKRHKDQQEVLVWEVKVYDKWHSQWKPDSEVENKIKAFEEGITNLDTQKLEKIYEKRLQKYQEFCEKEANFKEE